jgi:hypothetical protein
VVVQSKYYLVVCGAIVKHMKFAIYVGAAIGGVLGGYIPVWFFHANMLSMASLLWGSAGTIIGLVVTIKAMKYFGY